MTGIISTPATPAGFPPRGARGSNTTSTQRPGELDYYVPLVMAEAIFHLSAYCRSLQLFGTEYNGENAQQQGDSVNIPVFEGTQVRAVNPGQSMEKDDYDTPKVSNMTVRLDKWNYQNFSLTDLENSETLSPVNQRQIQANSRSLVESICTDIYGVYKKAEWFIDESDTDGNMVTPFSDGNPTALTRVRQALELGRTPGQDRSIIMNPETEAQGLNVRAFGDASYTADDGQAITQGLLDRKLGFSIYSDQVLPIHTTAGALSDSSATWALSSSQPALGATNITLAAALSSVPVAGDRFSIAGSRQVYTVIDEDVNKTPLTNSTTVINFAPGIGTYDKKRPAASAKVTFKPSYAVNLAFQRDALTFVSRPTALSATNVYRVTQGIPGTPLVIGLEAVREHYRDVWKMDVLYGYERIRGSNIAVLASPTEALI